MSTKQTLTADGQSEGVALIAMRGEGEAAILKTVFVQGDFGSGTATLKVSADGGSTWVDVVDSTGTAITFTVNGARNVKVSSVEMDNTNNDSDNESKAVLLGMSLASSTSPDLDMFVYQNR